MSRVAPLLVLLFAGQVTSAADLPPGSLARLGDDRFRAGSSIEHLAISPDGKQFATVRRLDMSHGALTLWDATTGRPIREHKLNTEIFRGGLFRGIVWNEDGGFAIFYRAEPGGNQKVFPNDFRVWEFTNPKAEVPPVLWVAIGIAGRGGPLGAVSAETPKDSPECTDFQFSGDGRRVAVSWRSADSKKFAVYVFELKATDTATKLKRAGFIDLGAEGADAVRIAADGKTVVTFRWIKPIDLEKGPRESIATVWDVATGEPQRPVRVPYSSVPLITPDARELVVPVWDDKDEGHDLVDLDTGKRRKLIRWPNTVRRGNGNLYPVRTFLPPGRVLVDGFDSSVSLVDLTTGKELGLLKGHADSPSAIAVSADGSRIATAANGLVRLWDAKTLRPLDETPGHRASVSYAQLSPDGKRVLTWAWDDTVRLWDLATGKELRAFAGASGVSGRADRPTFTPNGTTILYSTSNRLIGRDLQTGLEVPLPGDMAKLGPRGAVFSPDGKSVLTWAAENGDNEICDMWDWPSGKKRFSWDPPNDHHAPGFTPDGLVVFDHPEQRTRRDAKTGEQLPFAWKEDRARYEIASLRPSQKLLLENEHDKKPRIVEAGTGNLVTRFRLTSGEEGSLFLIQTMTLSPTGGQFASSWNYEPDDIYLFESATCSKRRVLAGHRGDVWVLGFTPDGTKLLTAGGDHTVLVWDMRLAHVPLPEAVKKETDAAKLWNTLASGNAKDAYLAMARLAREPDAAVRMAKLKLKPAAKAGGDTDASRLADARAIELLEALEGGDARSMLKELAGGHADAFRTQEAKRALERLDRR